MKFIGRDINLNVSYSMLTTHPYASLIQGFQKVRQVAGIEYRFLNNGKSFYPSIVTFEITHRCNLRCRTCWLWGTSGKYSGDEESQRIKEMSPEEVTRFIDSVSSFRPYFLITGGEPLLHPNIGEVIQHASSRGLIVGLITNGMSAAVETITKVVDAGLSFMTISVDSPDKDTHNLIRNNKNSFDNCLNTLGIVKRLKGEKRFPIVTTNLTISNYNYEHLRGMLELADGAGVDVLQFTHQWFSDRGTSLDYSVWAETNLGLKSSHMGTFEADTASEVDGAVVYEQLEAIREQAKKYHTYVRVSPDLTREDTVAYYRGMSPVYTDHCINPWSGALVKPNGDVVPCIDHVIGNVTRTPFKQIWNSENMRLFRKRVKEQKYFPGCTRCCGFFN